MVVQAATSFVHGVHFCAEQPRACLLLQGAAGVGQARYAALAAHLADQGISVLTYDYSDTGASRRSALTIGHFGFFSRKAAVLWTQLADYLLQDA